MKTCREYIEENWGAFLNPASRAGLDIGFPRLQMLTNGLKPGELWILSGWSAAGKSALALQAAADLASTGKSVAVFELEMTRDAVIDRILCNRARVNHTKYRVDALDGQERERIHQAAQELSQMPLLIDDRCGLTLATVHNQLLAFRSRGTLHLAIIDFLQLMGSESRENARHVSADGRWRALSRGLKLMARDLNVPFLVVSQLHRAGKTRESDHWPRLTDLRESIEQFADVVAFIHRQEKYWPDREELKGTADLLIAKQNNGPLGRVPLVFDACCMRFASRPESK